MSPTRSAKLTLGLSILALFLPFIWIKIGPKGIAFYGPDVPDIYILGIMCMGKDWGFEAIPMAMAFQLLFGISFILCSFIAYRRSLREAPVRCLTTMQLLLLILFPLWLGLYVNGIIHNSDGAASDLRVYPHVGFLVYVLLLALTINTHRKSSLGTLSSMYPAWVRGLSAIQLTLLLQLPLWLSPVLQRMVDHPQALLGMGYYSVFGLLAYTLLVGYTIIALLKGKVLQTR